MAAHSAEEAEVAASDSRGVGIGPPNVCFRPTREQHEFLETLRARPASTQPDGWTKTDWLRFLMDAYMRLERRMSDVAGKLEEYAVRHRFTIPQERRKAEDMEWLLDVVMHLARERLGQLEADGEFTQSRQ